MEKRGDGMNRSAVSFMAACREPVVQQEGSCVARAWSRYRRRTPCDRQDFEAMLCLHCAPTFAGLKAASLVSFKKSQYEDFDALLASYEPCFQCSGLKAFRLTDGTDFTLVLFYRPDALLRALQAPGAAKLLSAFGYAADDADQALDLLAARMQLQKSFPHEIGIFLGYPPSDVEGFIEHRGKNFSSSGYWKVYSDVQAAEATFRLYADCIEDYSARLRAGATLSMLLMRAA